MVQSIAEKQALTMVLRKGDMLFWNNAVHLHSRKAFLDGPKHKRHLVRIWLRSDLGSRKLPAELRETWVDTFVHAGRTQQWPIEPITTEAHICNRQRPCGYG